MTSGNVRKTAGTGQELAVSALIIDGWMLRFLTAGESHGQALVVTLDGMPAGLQVDIAALNAQLRRRQGGYGRGRRMQIESDTAEVIAGVRRGRTTGAPIAMLIRRPPLIPRSAPAGVEPASGYRSERVEGQRETLPGGAAP